jgi:putative ABC transport system permease protein
MNRSDLIRMAYNNLMQRKARTILTVLGVVIGTAAIVVMLSLGFGLNETQRKNMERWGSLNIIQVYSGVRYDEEGNPMGEEKVLNDEALAEIKVMEGVAGASPVITVGGEAKWGRKQGYIQLVGVDPTQMENLEFSLAAGRLLEEYDRNAIVVGSMVKDNFWDEREMRQGGVMVIRGGMGEESQEDQAEMLDQRITFTAESWSGEQTRRRVYNFQVVGVLDDSNMERAWDTYAPIEEIQRIQDFMEQGSRATGPVFLERAVYAGGKARQKTSGKNDRIYSYFLVRAVDVNKAKELSKTLRDMGYNAWSMADNLEGIEQVTKVMQAILGGIGGISLLVAALGITNTMIMSIYERTKEIGIMKVIGASFEDIRLLFLGEAGLIGAGGGAIGLVLSYLISYLLNRFGASYINQGMGMGGEEVAISIIPPYLALFAVAFAILVGLLSGLYPATRAMRLSPVVAIRNE